ncbi:MAG: gamma-glutamyltransferase, partial [Pseudomonadota bacterium]
MREGSELLRETTMQVGVATTSKLAADAGAEIADAGGNAVDVAIAASLASLVSEPGMVSLAGGGFLTIWPETGEPVTVDGSVAMPGLGSGRAPAQAAVRRVVLEYAGGMETLIAHGSVATPGILAAFDLASSRWGRLSWPMLLTPAIRVAREGFPLSSAAHGFMMHAHDLIYGWDPASHRALHTDDGRLKPIGDRIEVEHLADSLELIAAEGAAAFYRGDIGRAMADCITAGGGLMTREDLQTYEPVVRKPITLELDGWTIATAPPPSLGGAVLAAMLTLCADRGLERWDTAATDHLVRVQQAMLAHRFEVLDLTPDLESEVRRLLALAPNGLEAFQSPSTVHTSATDASRIACSITVSAGYGAGVMPPGTGIWMNNALGELELNRRGI